MDSRMTPIPPNEKERLEQLLTYEILDSLPNKQLDEITELATIICGVPIGLISIIDEKRQWFKSKVGLGVDETAREDAFCQYAILEDQFFEVENALEDERFKDNPLVLGDPNIRFYAAYPLFVEKDIALGTLCMISDKPNKLTAEQRKALRILSEQVTNYFRLQKELKERQQYAKFFQITSECICVVDMAGMFINLNPAFTEKLGMKKEDLIQTAYMDLIHPDDQVQTGEQVRKLSQEYGITAFVNRFRAADGSYLWMSWNAISDPKTNLIYASGRDINTEMEMKVALQKSKKRYHSFFENVQGLLITLDKEGVIEDISAEICSITGLPLKAFEKKTLKEIFSANKVEHLDAFIAEILTKGNAEIILELSGTDQEKYIYYFKGVLVNLGNYEQLILMTGVDIKSRIELEQNLKAAAVSAEENNQLQKDFLANMSHEIRTPLNAIIGFTDILSSTDLQTQQTQYLNAIHAASTHLLKIVNDILDISKVEADEVELESVRFNLRELFAQLRMMFEKVARDKELSMAFYLDEELPNWVIGDPARLKQILVNLLSNAIKFTEKGRIELFSKIDQQTEEQVFIEFRVKDTGIGIPKEKEEAIFSRFRQADASINREYGGTGLGLSISRRLVDLQGGSIELDSEEGKGSEFIIHIPFKKVETLSERVKHSKEESLVLMGDILVVEDNAMNCEIIKAYLKATELELFFAQNGQEALDFLASTEVDLILMDLQMPVMDGYTAAEKIRNEMQLKTPIIALTAHSMVDEQQRCLTLGMNAYLSKPYRKHELIEVMRPHLDCKSSLSEQLESSKGVFKPAKFIEFAEGNDSLAEMLAKNFIDHSPRLIERLFLGATASEYKAVADLAHELKPFYKMLAVEDLYDVCVQLEHKPDELDLTQTVVDLQRTNSTLIGELKTYFKLN